MPTPLQRFVHKYFDFAAKQKGGSTTVAVTLVSNRKAGVVQYAFGSLRFVPASAIKKPVARDIPPKFQTDPGLLIARFNIDSADTRRVSIGELGLVISYNGNGTSIHVTITQPDDEGRLNFDATVAGEVLVGGPNPTNSSSPVFLISFGPPIVVPLG